MGTAPADTESSGPSPSGPELEATEPSIDEWEELMDGPDWSRKVKIRQLEKMGTEPTEGMLRAADAIDRSALESAWALNREIRSGRVGAFRSQKVKAARACARRSLRARMRSDRRRRRDPDCIHRPFGRAARAATNTRNRGSKRGSPSGSSDDDLSDPDHDLDRLLSEVP